MLWIVFFIGLFIGANAGVLIAGLLFMAKKGNKVPIKTAYEDHNYSGAQRIVTADLKS